MSPSRLALLSLALILAAQVCPAQERRSAKVENAENVTLYPDFSVYAAFPYMPKTQPEDGVYVSFVTRERPSHADPTGGTAIVRSTDGCHTWEVVFRDAEGISSEESNALQALRTADGTLVSIHTGWALYPAEKRGELEAAGWDVSDVREGLIAALTEHTAMVSRDDGKTWETQELPLPNAPPNAPGLMGFHGGIVTDQDVLLWPVYGLAMPGDSGHSYVYRSADAGKTWGLHEIIADSRGLIPMNETALIDLGAGHILAFVRTGDEVDHLYRAESLNGGVTWGRLRDSGITGHPADLLRLRNGHILLTYGYRHAPFGVRALISKDSGETWGDEVILRDDGVGTDVGYPMSIQLADGTIFTVYYFRVPGGPTHIAGTLWHEPE